jgi:hypothetical protein
MGAKNVLFEAGEHGDCDESACMDLLSVDDPDSVDVLFVTFTKSARERIDALKRHADAPPANVGIVTVDVGGADGDGRIGGSSGPAVRRISDPSDLTGVGIAISEFLSAWHGNGNRTVVCFESVTALLQYVDSSRVFQFFNEITSKFEQSGARAHFHITPAAHEGQVLSVLTSLFDDRVTAAGLGYDPDQRAVTEEAGSATGPKTMPVVNPPADDTDSDATAKADDEATETEDETVETAESDADEDSTGFVFDATDTGDSDTTADETEPSEADRNATTDTETDSTPNEGTDETTETKEPTGEPTDDTEKTGADSSEPAAIVSSVINGNFEETAPDGDESSGTAGADSPFQFPSSSGGSGTDADADPESEREANVEGSTNSASGTAGHADPEEADGDSGQADTSAGAAATFGRQKRHSKHDPIERPQVQRPRDSGEDDSEYKSTLFSRTTATVIGVVVMVALISFLTAAVPMPAGAPITDGESPDVTPTPEPAAAAGVNGTQARTTPTASPTAEPTATATPEPTATPTPEPTATATPEPTATPTPEPTATATPEPTATATATPEPTSTATPEPTATPTESGDDSLTGVVDDTTDTLVGDDGLL